MPIHYEIDADRRLVYEGGHGPATREDFAALIRGLAEDEDFRPGMNGICDFRGLTFDLPTTEIEELCELMSGNEEAFRGSRFAVIVPRDLEFGLVRMFSLMLEGAPFQVRAFRELEEARLWLGLPEAAVDSVSF